MSKMEQDFQDIQDSQDFFSPSVQDQAILLYRGARCMAAPVVCDRLIANMDQAILTYRVGRCLAVGETSRVSMLSVRPTQARDRPSPYGILRSYGPFRRVTAVHL